MTALPPLDARAAAHLDALAARGWPGFSTMSAQDARAMHASLRASPLPPPPGMTIEDVVVDAVRVRRYTPRDAHGSIVYAHGGGWVVGSPESSDAIARALAVSSGARVHSVDYRLAPEHPFPAGLDDLQVVVDAVVRAGDAVVVAGDSAGGNLAAAVASRSGSAVRAQVLLYPVVDVERERASYDEINDPRYSVTGTDMRWFTDQYLTAGQRGEPDASPIRSAQQGRVVPTMIVVAGHDPLRDEGIDYAIAVTRAGVPVTLEYHPTLHHGFAGLVSVLDEAQEVLRRCGEFAALALH